MRGGQGISSGVIGVLMTGLDNIDKGGVIAPPLSALFFGFPYESAS